MVERSSRTDALTNVLSFVARSVKPRPTFRFRGKTYRVREAGHRTLLLLRDVGRAEQHHGGLLAIRQEVRRVLQFTPPALLCYRLSQMKLSSQIRLAIWILGKGKHHIGTSVVFGFCEHQDLKVRLECVRALKRLSAWKRLQVIEGTATCPITRCAASISRSLEFSSRIDRYLYSVERRPCVKTLPDLVVADGLEITTDGQPKDRWAIRLVLRKIHWFVRLSRFRRNRPTRLLSRDASR